MSSYDCQSLNVVSQGSSIKGSSIVGGNDLTLQVGSGGLLLIKRSASPNPPPSCSSLPRPLSEQGESLLRSAGHTVLCHPQIPRVILEYISFDEQKQYRQLNSDCRASANAYFQASAFECAFNLLKWGSFSPAVAPLELCAKSTPARALGFFDRIASIDEQTEFVEQLQDVLKCTFKPFSFVVVPDSQKFLSGYDNRKHRANNVRFFSKSDDAEPWLTIGRAETFEVSYNSKEKHVTCIFVPGTKRVPNCLFRATCLTSVSFENADSVTQIGHRFLEDTGVYEVDLSGFCNVTTIGRLFLAKTQLSRFSFPDDMGLNVKSVGNGFLTKCSSLKTVDLSSLTQLQNSRKWFCYDCEDLQSTSQFILPSTISNYHPTALAVEEWEKLKDEVESRSGRRRR